MATGNPYVPKHTPWRSSKNSSGETIEVPRESTRDKREQSLAYDMGELRDAWLEATGDPTLPRTVVERVNTLKIGEEEEFIVKKHGKVSHSVKMRRQREDGTDVLRIELAFPHKYSETSGGSSSGEKKMEKKKSPAITYLSDEEDGEDPNESSAKEEVVTKSKTQGKTGKGKGKEDNKGKEKNNDKEASKSKDKGKGKSEVSASTSEVAPVPETATTPAPTPGEWTKSEDTMIKSMKESNESWANIAKAVSRGKSEVQKRYKELMSNNEEPANDNKTEQSKGNKNDQSKSTKSGNNEQTKDGSNKQAKNNDNGAKAASAKSPKGNQSTYYSLHNTLTNAKHATKTCPLANTTHGLPTEPITGFPPLAMSSHEQNAVPYPGGGDPYRGYGEYPPPIPNYHPAYGYLPPVNYGYLPPPVNYGYPPPYHGNHYPHHPPGFINNNYNSYLGYPGPGPYMDPRFGAQRAPGTYNSRSADDTYDWFYNGEPGVRYLTRDGKRVLWIRCNNGDAIKINDHVLSEPPNGWRNDLNSKKKAPQRESQSIHARINSDCSVRIMGAEIDEPDGGWGDQGEGSTVWHGSKEGSQPADRNKNDKGPESAGGWGGGSSNGGNQKDDSQDNNWGGSQKDNSQDNDNGWGGDQKDNSGDSTWGNDQKDGSKANEEPTGWNVGNSEGSQKDNSQSQEWEQWADGKTDGNRGKKPYDPTKYCPDRTPIPIATCKKVTKYITYYPGQGHFGSGGWRAPRNNHTNEESAEVTEPSKPTKGEMPYDWKTVSYVVAEDKSGKGKLEIPQEKVPIPGCYPISPNDGNGSNADEQHTFDNISAWTGEEEKKDGDNNDTHAPIEWENEKKEDESNNAPAATIEWTNEKKDDSNNNTSSGDGWTGGGDGEWNCGVNNGIKTNTKW